jgi:diadenosine tetraphosphate (Ap4A) HIT family hydrolase
MEGCFACDLTAGRIPLPGGLIHRSEHWLVEPNIGPLSLGTLIVKPERHVTEVAALSAAEAAELGPLLRLASAVASELVTDVDQVYNCLWSHAGGRPVHIHYVVQPVTKCQVRTSGVFGPMLQIAMFEAGVIAPDSEIERVSDHARRLFSAQTL